MGRKTGFENSENKILDLEKLLKEQKENEQKLLEEIKELKTTQRYYNALMRNTDDYMVICDRNGIPQAFNESYRKIGEAILNIEVKPGMQPHKFSGKPEIIEYWESLQRRALNGEKFLAEFHDKESNQYFETLFCPIREGKEVTGFTEITRNITDRRRVEEALKESEKQYRSLVENTHDGYFICEIPSGSFLFLNQRICNLFGFSMEEGLRLTLWDVIFSDEHKYIRNLIDNYMEGRERVNISSNIYIAITRDGTALKIEMSTSIIRYEGKPVIQGLLRDVSETERLRSKLEQAQKLEAIGTLAGGLAHDYNNLLMGILGNASLMLLDIDPSHPYYNRLKDIEEYVQSGSELTKQMLGFARGGKYETKPTDMNEMVKKSSYMFGQTKKEITIHAQYQKDIWAVEVDQGQINQALLNLYVNAWQSMPGGGDLYLETKNIFLDDTYVKPFYIAPGNYVKISITDTGAGMDEATKRRIFDPFFTTKQMGRGTGLGLATVYGIIRNHYGIINVYSEKGEGATFNIYLPASEKSIVKEKEKFNRFIKGDETLLLVDDENMIINVGSQILESLGYSVLTAKTGREALEIYKENKEKIALIILDMIMPSMSGGAVYDELKKINPDSRVLLSSGYSINGQATAILKRGCNGFIQKPFSMVELSQKIREILDSK